MARCSPNRWINGKIRFLRGNSQVDARFVPVKHLHRQYTAQPEDMSGYQLHPEAYADLDAIREYITEDNSAAAVEGQRNGNNAPVNSESPKMSANP